ncbi:hypothetical protein [Brevibacillus sp. 179-C9.3 HS]|uniref:hypothetical protein n=1 Tax=unclassified Brevibacillus TaxID=2684853 RepID=UPI0039A1A31B
MKWLICLLLATSATGSWGESLDVIQTELAEREAHTFVERFMAEDLEKHPDVKAYIVGKGYEHVLKKDGQTDAALVSQFELQDPERKIEGIDKETIERLEQKYNLKPPEPEIIAYDQHILVERFKKDNKIRNVMIFTIINTHARGRIDVLNVRTGELESQKFNGPMSYDFGGPGWPEEPIKK